VEPLKGLRVAEHSGCRLTRPRKYTGFEDPENPVALRRLIEVTGAKCVEYMGEAERCGAAVAGVSDKMSLVGEKLNHIMAGALVTICSSSRISPATLRAII